MKTNKATFNLILSIFILSAVAGSGAFSMSLLRRECVKEASVLKKLEMEHAALKRENEFWSTQIAGTQTPAKLRERAEGKLAPTGADKLIHAYRVKDSAGKTRFAAIYRPSTPIQTASTAQR